MVSNEPIGFAEVLEDENNLARGIPTSTWRDVNGRPYVTLSIGGVKEEGAEIPGSAATPREARKLFAEVFRGFVMMHPGYDIVYWRSEPRMGRLDGRYTVLARVSLGVSAPTPPRPLPPKADDATV